MAVVNLRLLLRSPIVRYLIIAASLACIPLIMLVLARREARNGGREELVPKLSLASSINAASDDIPSAVGLLKQVVSSMRKNDPALLYRAEFLPTSMPPSWWPYQQRAYHDEFPRFVENVFFRLQKDRGSGQMMTSARYALWNAIRWLEPDVIIETGVFKGYGTAFIRDAAPDATIICFDSYPPVYVDPHPKTITKYLGRDFKDLRKVDLSKWLDDARLVVAVVDDHKSALVRLWHFLSIHNVTHFIYDDNYLRERNSNFSPHMLSNGLPFGEKGVHVVDSFDKRDFRLSYLESFGWFYLFRHHLMLEYFEFPPIVNDGKYTEDWPISGALWTMEEFKAAKKLHPNSLNKLTDREVTHYSRVTYFRVKSLFDS